jgi:AraC-like DNA-binding protein
VVEGPDADARGIVAPDAGLTRFRLDRFEPTPGVGRFVAWFWRVTWDLRGRAPHTQQVLSHPVVNVVFQAGGGIVVGVQTRIAERTLEDEGWALGVMFRPAGFSPFVEGPAKALVDQTLDIGEVFGDEGVALATSVAEAGPDRAHDVVDGFLAARVPDGVQPSESVSDLVEKVAADPALLRVEDLADRAGCSPRQLQRRFAEHVGVSPKWVIRRYRLYEAAERAARGTDIRWADLAAELGYSDQAHLTREFTAALGMPPDRYATYCRESLAGS